MVEDVLSMRLAMMPGGHLYRVNGKCGCCDRWRPVKAYGDFRICKACEVKIRKPPNRIATRND